MAKARCCCSVIRKDRRAPKIARQDSSSGSRRSEEHTSELQSRQYLVCRPPQSILFPYTTLFRSVIIDSALASDQIASFVATDNRKGGMLAAERMGELLNGKGKVLLLRYQEGSASTEDREAGFIQRLKEIGRAHV